MTEFYSHGKLLLTSEYAVLNGAEALAIPTKFGQYLKVKTTHDDLFHWESLDHKSKPWFTATFRVEQSILAIVTTNDSDKGIRLQNIIGTAQNLRSSPLRLNGTKVSTELEFDQNWGLGSSSTLINNIAEWFKVDAFTLLRESFGGSGYDIACAKTSSPIVYATTNGISSFSPVQLHWSFTEQLYFVYLNKKQNSREGIANYKRLNLITASIIDRLNTLTKHIINAQNGSTFDELINEHNDIISGLIKMPSARAEWFPDFKGSIKNLGAWGGDFIMVRSDNDPKSYFKNKGFNTIVSYKEMAL